MVGYKMRALVCVYLFHTANAQIYCLVDASNFFNNFLASLLDPRTGLDMYLPSLSVMSASVADPRLLVVSSNVRIVSLRRRLKTFKLLAIVANTPPVMLGGPVA